MTNEKKAKRVYAVIPARGGSKGIPKKNLFPIMAKPLLQYTFEAAKESQVLDRILLSSEDDEIIHFAQLHNIDTSYRRPNSLASDATSTLEVIQHLIDWLERAGDLPDVLVVLQPTSPLRSSEDITKAVTQFIEDDLDSMVSVHSMIEHPFKSMKVDAEGNWQYLENPPTGVSRRQDYPSDFYTINGALYLIKPQWFQEKGKLVQEGETDLFPMTPISGIDVDELLDVFKVEAYLKMLS
ncbi:MAG: acylneuraminate cytidylyltransferase family protein [Hydrogenovibrio sp.]|uniref:acylneuraminate cytidylyltransferase family protein n=1 Tax=Hydrogenovibrio sp. TaxID=2065821 RepID=UPI00286FC10D|nr:acylneuraminate cytidylyltransferase family protein [Hydrogenovibrio sp.]MDR9499367.1 acylneuraminate cytidylyltransferase family protein [Hydrogenovibrio sp.]